MTKTVLITGSSSGIGQAAVEAFARAGWQVAATSRHPDAGSFNQWPSVRSYQLDVTDQANISEVFAAVCQDFKTIDVVVNNAGYGVNGVFESIDNQQIRRQFETNVFGLMNITRQAIKVMRASAGGTIVQISSMGGKVTFPFYSIYHASKWAVEGFSESLHYELKPLGINIKIVEPGVIKTKFYGPSRVLVPSKNDDGYKDFFTKVESVSQNAAATGEDPKVVATTILKAATSKSSRLRYVVGSPAPQLLVARKLLPERIFFFLVNKRYRR